MKLLDAAVTVIREKGLSATSVDELCVAAGVTKGAFFHHFESKEVLAVAAAGHWSQTTGELFAGAPYHQPTDPVDRIFAYLDFREALVQGSAAEYSCLAGTMVQEAFDTSPPVREACAASILGHAATLEADFRQALVARHAGPEVDAAGLARHTQVVLQGAFVLGKATGDPQVVRDSIQHLRRYLQCVLGPDPAPPPPSPRT
ncbi:MAG: TetR/AcrR family transcriptional regulator [Actinomycetota bacterium]|nr:TetR/AcrR family transcriptional regulator [Actinomycetota bacterium]